MNDFMNNQPFVSIITGYYNRLQNLEESVQSVLNQSYKNFEYIIFDDCSNDGTLEALEQIEHSRIKLIKHPKNLGFTKGMIQAISECNGEYIAIHGAGDIALPQRIEKQVNLLQSDINLGIVGCLLLDKSKDGESIINPKKGNNKFNYTHGEVMYRREAYFMAGGYNSFFDFGQFTFLKNEILKYYKGDYVNEVLYERIHYNNGVSKNKNKIISQQIFVTIGKEISDSNFLNTNVNEIIIEKSLQYSNLLKNNYKDEALFLKKARRKNLIIPILYHFYKKNIIPKYLLFKISNSLKKKRLENNKCL